MSSRSLYGGVDWNFGFNLLTNSLLVAPYMGAWIEIMSLTDASSLALVAPYMGAWIEILS